ncbi:MAG: haloacid dehalogenase, partial [Betaproteobacteria bacterium]|nr:haloacid dehalogenase [Betaproteobacteria bacterium]
LMNVEMVAFDVAGTVLNDDGLVIAAFRNAFEATQPDLWPTHGEQWTQYAIDTMGQSKIHVFTELLGDAEKAHTANVAFEESYVSEIAEVGAVAIAGAEDTLLIELGWKDLIDISVTPGEAGRGRPHPDMLQKAATTLGITNPASVIVVGDTAADMQAAVSFGAGQAIGVLSGAHDEHRLHDAGATSVINSVADLKSLI